MKLLDELRSAAEGYRRTPKVWGDAKTLAYVKAFPPDVLRALIAVAEAADKLEHTMSGSSEERRAVDVVCQQSCALRALDRERT